jgi:hypothetical protein
MPVSPTRADTAGPSQGPGRGWSYHYYWNVASGLKIFQMGLKKGSVRRRLETFRRFHDDDREVYPLDAVFGTTGDRRD